MYTLLPFFRYSPAISASRCHSTTLCHSVRSAHWPSLSLKRSLVATVSFATGVPLGVYFTSGSLPRFPINITLFRLFAMKAAPSAPSLRHRELVMRNLQGLDGHYNRNGGALCGGGKML